MRGTLMIIGLFALAFTVFVMSHVDMVLKINRLEENQQIIIERQQIILNHFQMP